jgi:hypothetical protein
LNERILNESPKLKALIEVLEEISDDNDMELDEINILIAANNDRTCLLIKQVIIIFKIKILYKKLLNILLASQKK